MYGHFAVLARGEMGTIWSLDAMKWSFWGVNKIVNGNCNEFTWVNKNSGGRSEFYKVSYGFMAQLFPVHSILLLVGGVKDVFVYVSLVWI